MKRPSPPTGFVALGLVMAFLGMSGAAYVFSSGAGWFPRLLGGGVAVLSLLVAEALWWMRPWLGRVIVVWALACPLALIAADLAGDVRYDASPVVNVLAIVVRAILFVGTPCVVACGYVRAHANAAGLLQPPHRVTP